MDQCAVRRTFPLNELTIGVPLDQLLAITYFTNGVPLDQRPINQGSGVDLTGCWFEGVEVGI